MDCFTASAPVAEGAQDVIYDTALRGVHHENLLRDLGLLSINRVTAAKANPKARSVIRAGKINDWTVSCGQ